MKNLFDDCLVFFFINSVIKLVNLLHTYTNSLTVRKNVIYKENTKLKWDLEFQWVFPSFLLCNSPLKKSLGRYIQKGLYSEITWSFNKNVNQDLTLNPSVFFLLLHWVTPTQFPMDHSENPSHKTLLIRLTHDLFLPQISF